MTRRDKQKHGLPARVVSRKLSTSAFVEFLERRTFLSAAALVHSGKSTIPRVALHAHKKAAHGLTHAKESKSGNGDTKSKKSKSSAGGEDQAGENQGDGSSPGSKGSGGGAGSTSSGSLGTSKDSDTGSTASGSAGSSNGQGTGKQNGDGSGSTPQTKPTPQPQPAAKPVDDNFGGGAGIQTTFSAHAVLVRDDGTIVVAGQRGDQAAGQSEAVVERRKADGSLDTTFGTSGDSVRPAGSGQANLTALSAADGGFFTAGTSEGDFATTRYDANGNIDTSFGQAGQVATNFGTQTDVTYALATAPGGQLIAAGGAGGNFAFARYDSVGNLDPSFGQGGRELFAAGSGAGVIGKVAVLSDGSLIAVGQSGANVVVVRLDAKGNPVASFGSGGLLVVTGLSARQDSNGPDASEGLAIQPDGKILVANHTVGNHLAVARLNADGTFDTTFGVGGIATATFGGNDDADTVLVKDNGTIIAVGTTDAGGTPATAVAAFDAQGNPLGAFGTGGLLTLPTAVAPSRELHIGDLVLRAFGALQPNGQVLVGASGQGPAAATASSLHRLIIPDTAPVSTQADLGSFGVSGGKRTKLTVTTADGTQATLSLIGGAATATRDGQGIKLAVNAVGRCTLRITTEGGSGLLKLMDVTVTGSLLRLTARSADLAGTLYATGAIGKLAVRNVTGVIASGSGVIGGVSAANLDGARILSGANLGADGSLGGNGANGDSFRKGSIAVIHVDGAIRASLVAAGLNPVNDTVTGGASSFIHSIITAGTVDDTTRFIAGAFGLARLPLKVDVTRDPRFKTE